MKKIPPFLAAFAIITSPIAAQAAVVTYGDLQYDALSGLDIVNTVTGKRYLNLSVGKDWTYAVTLDMIANGGYGDYHIASQQEAFEFANAFKIGALSDTEGHTQQVYSFADWIDGSFGPNHSAGFDVAWFLSDEFQGAGQIRLRDAPRLPNLLRINDIAGTIPRLILLPPAAQTALHPFLGC